MSTRLIFPALLALAATGCAGFDAAPEDRAPPLEVPADWRAGAPDGWRGGGWLADLGDPVLSRLVDDAVSGNFSLQSAASRVQAARARARIAGADPVPQAALTAGASRSDQNRNGAAGIVDNPANSFELRGQVSWETDLWGRLSDNTRAAQADWRAARADYEAARLSLAANVARVWFDTIAARAQASLARDTVASFEQSLATIENRFRQGIGEALDVRLARNNLANAQASLAQRRRQERNGVRELETLLGRYPAGDMEPSGLLPEVVEPVPAGLPAELLTRRADVAAAEARLGATGFRLANAEKNRLPGLTLTAGGGTSSDSLRDLVKLDTFVWSIAADLVQPLFQGGRLAAERDLARANDSEALNDYARTILTAFREVEDALDSENYLADQVAASRIAAAEAQAAEKLALDQYRRGLTGIITLLESQRRKFNADSALIDIVNQRLQNRINLHLALGGDFRTPPDRPQTASSARTAE